MFVFILASICLVWYVVVVFVCLLGYTRLFKWYSTPPPPSISAHTAGSIPHITILRPVKGLDPCLYECLVSSFQQSYPHASLTTFICLEDRDDPAVPVVTKVLQEFPEFDAHVCFATETSLLQINKVPLGPNPKIRQLSAAYHQAKGDIIWVLDCNVWVGKDTCGALVDKLCGYGEEKPFKFVHQLPLVIDTDTRESRVTARLLVDSGSSEALPHVSSTSTMMTELRPHSARRSMQAIGGGRLEEMFMSSSHAKFYTAINTVSIAPCIVGKSNMFRKSHLDVLTNGLGVDYFSHNICEDHLIGDLIWKNPTPKEVQVTAEQDPRVKVRGSRWGNHGLVLGHLAIQPMGNMSVKEYMARRARWLRVRKFTVLAATLVEPGTESFLCSLYGAFAITSLPFFQEKLGIPPTWTSFALFWLLSVTIWATVDHTQYRKLHSAQSINVDENTPSFARRPAGGVRRPFPEWVAAWIGRETLAFPIWFWAVWCGQGVTWRGKSFYVGSDMIVHARDNGRSTSAEEERKTTSGSVALDRRKARRD